MPYIRVNPNHMQHTTELLSKIGRDIGKIEESLSSVSNQLDWDVKREQDIDWMLRRINQELSEEAKILHSMHCFLNDAINQYAELDHSSLPPGEDDNKQTENVSVKKLLDFQCELVDRVANLVKVIGKIEDDDVKGFSSDILKYIHDFMELTQGGSETESDIAKLFDFADSSSSVWKGFYEILKEGLASEADKLKFTNKFGTSAAIVGVIGEMCGFLGAYIQYAKTGNQEDFTDMLKSLVGVGKEIYTSLSDPVSSYPVHVYTSIIKAGVDFLAEVGECVSKYSADGDWSWGDTGRTGIEASLSAINTLISELSYHFISLEAFGASIEEIIQTTITGAENWGAIAGKFIFNDPKLKKMYDEADNAGKRRLLIWAILKIGKMTLKSM